tara:strand:+ start:13905 stop:14912 length:1008 start_codon:yes stop_codon:yes gene_type:complete
MGRVAVLKGLEKIPGGKLIAGLGAAALGAGAIAATGGLAAPAVLGAAGAGAGAAAAAPSIARLAGGAAKKIGGAAKTGAKAGVKAAKDNPMNTAALVQGAQASHAANAQAAKQASEQRTMEAAQHGKEISTGTAKSDEQYHYADWMLEERMHDAWFLLKESMPGRKGYPEDDPDMKNRNCPVCKGVGWVQDPNGESPMNECWFCDGLKEDFTGQYEVGFNDDWSDNPMPEVYPDAPLFSERFQQIHTSEPMEVANRLLKARMEIGPHDEQQDDLFEHLKNVSAAHSIRTNEDDNSFKIDDIHDDDEDIVRRLIESFGRSEAEEATPFEETQSNYF